MSKANRMSAKNLLKLIESYIPKPHHPDEETQERINVYYNILLICGSVASVVVLACLVSPLFWEAFSFRDLLIISIAPTLLLVGCVICYALLRRLMFEYVLWIYVGMIIVAYSAATLFSPHGIYDPGLFAITLVMVVLGYYGSEKSLSVFTGAMIALLVVEFALERLGFKETLHPLPPSLHLIQYTMFLLTIRWFVTVSVRRLKERTRLYRESR
ncbi:MAG: hypothetical protein AAGD96_22080, partial [Chloroflexota bacterium]